jgi:hypothetical protein
MGNPPNTHQPKAAERTPTAFRTLYLANDITTTLYEVRASLFDYVTVGTFRLEENISVDKSKSLRLMIFLNLQN